MTRLQLALDGELPASLALLEQVRAYIDIAEIGTPLIFREGAHAIRRIRERQPALKLVADLKIMDAGEKEALIAFEAGADIATVMAVASDATVAGALRGADSCGKRIMVDMMQLAQPLARARQLLALGCDLLCLHTAHDEQASRGSPYAQLAALRRALPETDLAIAGGVALEKLDQILPFSPQVVIVGSAIAAAADPGTVARQMRERMDAYGT